MVSTLVINFIKLYSQVYFQFHRFHLYYCNYLDFVREQILVKGEHRRDKTEWEPLYFESCKALKNGAHPKYFFSEPFYQYQQVKYFTVQCRNDLTV